MQHRKKYSKGSSLSNDADPRKGHLNKFDPKKERRHLNGERISKEKIPDRFKKGLSQRKSHPMRSLSTSVDPHLASKMAQDLKRDITNFRQRRSKDELFCSPNLHPFFSLIPPSFITQHLHSDVKQFSQYLPKFQKGLSTPADGFLLWYEWASYEKTKGKNFSSASKNDNDADNEAPDQTKKEKSEVRQTLAKTYKEREHVRSLLVMCTRHNSEQRKTGQHAFINFINSKLTEDEVDWRSLELLKQTAHHSVAYALSRLVLGLTEDNFFLILAHFQALYLLLTRTQISPAVILSVIEEEFTLEERMKACRSRVSNGNGAIEEENINPDDITDPTKGERNQRLTAAVFAAAAIVVSKKALNSEDASRLCKFLSFCYVEQKATRVISSNLLFQLFRRDEATLRDEEAFQWFVFAFFSFPKLEYFRPEAVQFLLILMQCQNPPTHLLPSGVTSLLALDPLEPSNLEQICNALFRREQVTAVHPMIHPVWNDIINLIMQRCDSGESMKAHFSSFVHTAITPYRRGNVDIPRRILFQSLVAMLGQLAVKNSNAEERMEILHMASKNAGYGRATAAKPSSPAELKLLSPPAVREKVDDIIVQLRRTKDSDPASFTNRRWALRELKGCLSLPGNSQNDPSYINKAVMALLEFGFFSITKSRDVTNQNRCIFLFADFFSFTYSGFLSRPKCTLKGLDIITAYLKAEGRNQTRFSTAVTKASFRKARNKIVEALEKSSERSVLFYDDRDIEKLFTLLFLVLSVDDPSNAEAKSMATSVVPDLVQFYANGSIETIDLLYDVLMALVMRASLPIQVAPIMTCVRRIAIGCMLKFSRFIRTKSALDIILAPLREAYRTDMREKIRQQKSNELAENESGDEESDDGEAELDSEGGSDDDLNSEPQSENESSSEDAETSEEDEEEIEDRDDSVEGETKSDATEISGTDEDDDENEDEDDEPPTQEYIEALKGMIGDVDLDHTYPTDTAYSEKRDIVRAIQLATRVGCAVTSPLVVHIYQVLLAVCRESVKNSDDTIFNAAHSSIEMLLLSKNRYFGSFLQAPELFQVLGDIQSYCRKSIKSLLQASSTTPKMVAAIRYRMEKLKVIALRVFHFLSYLAYKNHGDDGVRIVFSEYYKSIFCDRGWNGAKYSLHLKQDIFYYRLGYMWALVPAVFEKFSDVEGINSPQRIKIFCGCCNVIEALLPRLTRIPAELKKTAKAQICHFIQSVSINSVYSMKCSLTYFYLHAIKMILKYNKRVGLDEKWVEEKVLQVAVDNDDIKMTAATIRILSSIERLLNVTPRAKETKAPVPMRSLYQESRSSNSERGKPFRSAKRVRSVTLKKFLAATSAPDPSEGRSLKRQKREEMKVKDRLQRQVMREAANKNMTKEQREERRKRMMVAKQERIAKNKERKRRLHELRQKSFEKWRQEKINQSLSQE